MSNDYLQHYGVPGMRWGRRSGGTNIPDDRIRRNRTDNSSGTTNSASGSHKSTKPPMNVKAVKEGLDTSKKFVENGSKRMEDSRKKQVARDLKSEAKKMSDDDLRKVINRLSMEERYVSAMEKEGVGKGKSNVQKTLEVVGTAVTYAGTALAVYEQLQKVRGR